ncbi:MAG TPA: FTR1 family protein [Polyangiales bacterium]|nr:FTR1 family protein [Polyangiales bacterium]
MLLKTIFTCVTGAALACLLCSAGAEAQAGRDGLRQIAGILDYIGGDYRGAVAPDGRILDEAEYAEQLSLAKDADALAAQAGLPAEDPVRSSLAQLSAALTAKQAPEQVQNLCRKAREVLVTTQHLSLVPAAAPARSEAEQLYRTQGCASCHGEDGSAQTPAAQPLDPKPANFLDPERVATVSPHRAFHALTFGVPGTAMVAYPALNDAQRWGLAFYVLSLRHQNADLALGRRALEGSPVPDLAALSALTEEELGNQLQGVPEAGRAAALAYLRVEAPFQRAGGGLKAIPLLDEGLAAYAAGDRVRARKLFISAYLDGFEPHEAGLRARDAGLVSEIETSMLGLRIAASEGKSLEDVRAAAQRARTLLLRAQDSGSNATTALLGSLTIALREGLEIVLLVAALLGLVRKRGYPQLARFVHAGWLAAIPAGLATYALAGSLLGGMERELAEGVASLLAAAVLLGVTHWMLGQMTAKKWVGFLAKQVTSAASSGKAALFVWCLAFLAAYREAFEIVLFYQALVLDAGEHVKQVWLGTGLGLAILAVIAMLLLRVGQKLRPAPFMLASSVFLALLSFMLVGKGVRALQEAAVLAVHPLPLPELQWLGIYATREGLIAQGALSLALLASALWPWWSARRRTVTGATAAE